MTKKNIENKIEGKQDSFTWKEIGLNLIKTPFVYYAIARFALGAYLIDEDKTSISIQDYFGIYFSLSSAGDFFQIFPRLVAGKEEFEKIWGSVWYPFEISFPYALNKFYKEIGKK